MRRILHDNSSPTELNLAAAAIIFDAGGRVLLIKENYGRHRYGPPGGRLEADETPKDALIREVREESGIEVRVVNLIGVYYLRYAEGSAPLISFACRCEIENGFPSVPPTGEIAEVGWFDPAHLPAPLTNLAPHAIRDAVAGMGRQDLGAGRNLGVPLINEAPEVAKSNLHGNGLAAACPYADNVARDLVDIVVRDAANGIVAGPIHVRLRGGSLGSNTLQVTGRLRLDVVAYCSTFSVRIDGVQ